MNTQSIIPRSPTQFPSCATTHRVAERPDDGSVAAGVSPAVEGWRPAARNRAATTRTAQMVPDVIRRARRHGSTAGGTPAATVPNTSETHGYPRSVAPRRCAASRLAFAFLLLGIPLPFLSLAAPSQTLYQTSFEAPVFTPGLPIRGQDGWEMFHDGEAISISTSNALTGAQCLRIDGALLEQVGPNSAQAYCFSQALEAFASNPPPVVEIRASVRLDGPQTGTLATPEQDVLSANLIAVVSGPGGQAQRFGGFYVSAAGRIWTTSPLLADDYKYSVPYTFGTYRRLIVRVDFMARRLTWLVDDVELGSGSFPTSSIADRLLSGYCEMGGALDPINTPELTYNRDNYTAYFDDYSLVAIPIEGGAIRVEQPVGVRLPNRAATVDFGSTIIGVGAQRTFLVRNIGTEDLTGVAVTLDGADAGDFTVNVPPASTVSPGSHTTFVVGFSAVVAGTRRAALHIASNAGNTNPFDIALTGTGVTPTQIAQEAYLKGSNTGAFDYFGASVAVSGDTMVIGAYGESSKATGVNGDQNDNTVNFSGAAYVFIRSGTNWIQQAYLKASNPGARDYFGFSVAVAGDTVVIGAYGESSNAVGVDGDQANNTSLDSGAAYVFVRDGTNWTQQAYLKASNTGAGGVFGFSVAVSGDTVVVGSHGEPSNATGINGDQSNNSSPNSGAAYVFARNGTNWTQQAYLKASNSESNDFFGSAVTVSGNTLVVGAGGEDSNAIGINGDQASNSSLDSGAAYVFVRNESIWTQQAYLKASNTGNDDFFGFAVAVSGDTVVVGALYESSSATGVNGDQNNNNAGASGAAYVFVRQGTAWAQQSYLKASNTEAFDGFGLGVSISGDVAVIAAPGESSNATGVNGNQADNSALGAGAAYVFLRQGATWVQQAYLKASNTEAFDGFGSSEQAGSVAVSGDTVVVGASFESSNATGINGNQANNSARLAGAAYVFNGVGGPRGPAIDTQPVPQNVLKGSTATFTVSATTTNPPLSYQWRFNGADLPGATGESLTIPDAQVANLGNYQVVVSDSVGSTRSAAVRLDLIDALFITTQPADVAVRAGSNATFTVAVYGTAPLHAQWRFNGADLANATNLVLTLTNVQAAQLGDYTVVITNQYGAVTSAVATLTFLTPPTIVAHPQPVTVTAGENATFTVTVTNTATLPITYQWRKGSTVLTNIVLHARTCSFTLFNVQTNVTTTDGPGNYRVVVQNVVNPSPGLASSLAALTVQPAVPRPTITGYARLASGAFQLQFSGVAGTSYTILASTNLLDWTSIGAPTATSPGQFEFTDATDPMRAHRFYRVKQD